jgi:hypothetical protein
MEYEKLLLTDEEINSYEIWPKQSRVKIPMAVTAEQKKNNLQKNFWKYQRR